MVEGTNLAGFAAATRIWGDRAEDTRKALEAIGNHFDPNKIWGLGDDGRPDHDLRQAADILNGAIGYDVLYDLLSPDERKSYKKKIADSAKDLADAADAGEWWTEDLVQNHNWVNFGAIGVAGQALEGESDDALHWQEIAQANFKKVKAVQDLVTDGSWHEGIGYLEFGLSRAIAYWLGAVRSPRTGGSDDKSVLLSKVGRYILYAQLPNQPRVHVMTHGDWVWSRPGLIAVLRWAARRFSDRLAQEAAHRWDLDARLTRQEFALDYALEYIAYDPTVVALDPRSVLPLDIYNDDQQSVILRSSWDFGKRPPEADPLVVGFKAGVFGGRGNYERIRTCAAPDGILNYGHDHEDDLGLWIYGRGGWLLPEAVAYSCCLVNSLCCRQGGEPSDYHSTPWHNAFLFDGVGQLGDTKSGEPRPNRTPKPREDSKRCGHGTPPAWFYSREASMPLHVSTDHYAFARGDGTALYDSTLGVTMLLRTVGFCREKGGFVVVQDRVALNTPRIIEQLLHAMRPSPDTNNSDSPWLKLTNLNGLVLGVRVVAPSPYRATISTETSNSFQEFMHDNGRFGYVRVAPASPDTNVIFLEVLWPTSTAAWASRPTALQPLDPAQPQRGFSAPLGASSESWIYNTSGGLTTAGDLRIQGTDRGSIGIRRSDSSGTVERLVMQGEGQLTDQYGKRTLLDLGTNTGALEVAFTGTRADLSGTAGAVGVQFYGPHVSEVHYNGKNVQWLPSQALVKVTGVSP